MAAKTTVLENIVLNLVARNTPYSQPATLYVGLFTSATNVSGGGTEVTDPSYARQTVTFGAPVSGVCANTAVVTFPAIASVPATVGWVAYFDSLSGGNMLYQGPVTLAKTAGVGDIFSFGIGVLTLGET